MGAAASAEEWTQPMMPAFFVNMDIYVPGEEAVNVSQRGRAQAVANALYGFCCSLMGTESSDCSELRLA